MSRNFTQDKKKLISCFDTSEIPNVSANFGKFEAAFNYHNCIQYGTIGNAKVQFCKAKNMKAVVETIYNRAEGKELLAAKLPLDKTLFAHSCKKIFINEECKTKNPIEK